MNTFKIFILLFIFLNFVLLGAFSFFIYQISTPLDAQDKISQIFIVEVGLGSNEISRKLKDSGLIDNDLFFTTYAYFVAKSDKLQAGVYELNPALSIKEIVRIISGGDITGFERVTIPEGFTSSQVEARLIEAGIDIEQGEFVAEVKKQKLEGYLFPDTYELRTDTSVQTIIDKFLRNFEQKTKNFIDQSNNFYQTLILASLIEREVQTAQDMKLVSGVLHNRLDLGMVLQVDATLIYLTGKKTGELTNNDKLIDSFFNTYKYRGLPPAPIANPGLNAINAALEPTTTDFLYYLNAPDGTTIFSRTLDEHNANRIKYLSR